MGPPQLGPTMGSSQSPLVLGVLEVGELSGGVTGALMEPVWTKRWWGNLDVAEDEPEEERFLSQGMREFGSGFVVVLAL